MQWAPYDADVAYAFLYPEFFRSVDKGLTWTTWFTLPTNPFTYIVDSASATGMVVYAVGRTYGYDTNGNPESGKGVVWRLAGAKDSTNVVATDCTGNLGALQGAYTNTYSLGSGSWQTGWHVQRVCLDPLRPNVVLVTTAAGVFRSTNATTSAATWEKTDLPPPIQTKDFNGITTPLSWYHLLCSPNEGAFYAGSVSNGIYRSDDAGATWSLFSIGRENPDCGSADLAGRTMALDNDGKRLYVANQSTGLWRARIAPILNIVGTTNPATGGGAGVWTNWYKTAVSRSLTNVVVNGTNLCAFWSLSGGQTDTNGAIVGIGTVSFAHTHDTTLTLQWLPVTAASTMVGLQAGPGGTVSPAGATMATQDAPVAIMATPSNGYAFASWQVMAGTASFDNSNAASTTVTLDAPATIRANFHDRKHILVTSTSLSVPEGGTATFQVKLAGVPAADMSVVVARTSGDADITVQTGTNLTFTTGNWDTYQTVTLAAAEDTDATNGTATIVCSASGMDSVTGTVTEVENDTVLTLTSGVGGTALPSGSSVVTMGVSTQITAIAGNGYAFTAWQVVSGDAIVADIHAATTTVTITAPATVQAYFVELAAPPSGTVWAWGLNTSGELGDGTSGTNRLNPVQTVGLSNVTAILGGNSRGMALDTNGNVWTWGWNGSGQLGDGTTITRLTPVRVSSISNITAIAMGLNHTVALQNNGTVWAWGGNNYGAIGDGTRGTNRVSPLQVLGLSNVTAIATGDYETYAVKSNATVWAWGYNNSGQSGDGTGGTYRLSPVQVLGLSNVTAITVGRNSGSGDYVLARKDDSTVWAWGANQFGQLGNGTNTASYATPTPTPAQVKLADGSALSNVTTVVAAPDHALALKNDGTAWAWGNNSAGQLGDGTSGNKRRNPVQVLGLTNVTAIAGGYNSYALNGDGTVSGWGPNSGFLGDGTSSARLAPVTISGISNVIAIDAGMMALKSDHTVWAWGTTVGDGTTTLRMAPVQVMMSDGATPLSDVTAIFANGNKLVIRNPQPRAGIVSDRTQVSVPEGGTATLQVKLADQPMGSVSMVVGWLDGDTNINVSGGASLTFGINDWNTYQTVTLAAAEDADTADGQATIACWVDGLGTLNVSATEQDNDTTLTFTAGPGGTTGPSGPVVVTKGVARDVCAFAAAGYVFTNWTVTTGSVTFSATTYDGAGVPTTFMTISSAATVRANFVLTPYEAWRRASFTTGQLANLAISGDAADPDQDGMNNQQEYVARTDPTNQASVFQITALSFTPYFQVQFLSASDRLYTLNWSTNLVAGVWRTVPGQVRVASTGGLTTLSDTNAAGLGRFYRLIVDLPDVQNFADVTATAALGMIVDRHNDSDFIVLDVRTATEYNTLHILGAINRDFYADDFEAQLNALDKNKAYLIHCRTGGRSGITYGIMQGLGFHEVYNLLGGIEAFQVVPGASAWLVVGP